MKISKTLRLLLGVVILLVVVGAIWWVVGYSLGKTVLSETGGGAAFKAAFGFKDAEVLRLMLLALVSLLVRQLPADGAGRVLRLGGAAALAAIVSGGGRAEMLSVGLFVFAAAAVAEARAVEALLASLVAGAVVALAGVLDTGLQTGHQLLSVVLRDLFYFAPLLFGPELLDAWVWKRAD